MIDMMNESSAAIAMVVWIMIMMMIDDEGRIIMYTV
jgi:hypothetical protein